MTTCKSYVCIRNQKKKDGSGNICQESRSIMSQLRNPSSNRVIHSSRQFINTKVSYVIHVDIIQQSQSCTNPHQGDEKLVPRGGESLNCLCRTS